jgi:hypothetical protein
MNIAILLHSSRSVRTCPPFGFSIRLDRSLAALNSKPISIEQSLLAAATKFSVQIRSWISPIFLRTIFSCALIFGSPLAYSAGEHQYLVEGNLLVSRLTDILVREGICESAAKCASNDGGHAFVKPVKDGLEISIYGINRVEISSKLLQESVGSFSMRDIGRHLSVHIFESSKEAALKQNFPNKRQPTFSLRVEK